MFVLYQAGEIPTIFFMSSADPQALKSLNQGKKLSLIRLFLGLRGGVMQYAKRKSVKQGSASLSYIPLALFLVENKQKKMKKQEKYFQFFKTFHDENHETNPFEFVLFVREMHGI